MDYRKKYLKYKEKYLNLKTKLSGGLLDEKINELIEFIKEHQISNEYIKREYYNNVNDRNLKDSINNYKIYLEDIFTNNEKYFIAYKKDNTSSFEKVDDYNKERKIIKDVKEWSKFLDTTTWWVQNNTTDVFESMLEIKGYVRGSGIDKEEKVQYIIIEKSKEKKPKKL